jgi:hypothetical protein
MRTSHEKRTHSPRERKSPPERFHEKNFHGKNSTGKTPWENQIPDHGMETTRRMLSFSPDEKVTACEERNQSHHPKTPNPKNPNHEKRVVSRRVLNNKGAPHSYNC